jgi:hypothetical protein
MLESQNATFELHVCEKFLEKSSQNELIKVSNSNVPLSCLDPTGGIYHH